MRGRRPASVVLAIWLLAAMIVLGGITALLTVVLEDELIAQWAEGRVDVGAVQPPSLVPVAIVMFVVIAVLAGVLVEFFREGYQWARVVLTFLVATMALATLAGLRVGPPLLFVVLTVAALVLDVAVLACLWHPDTTAYVRASGLSPAEVESRSGTRARTGKGS